MNLGTYSRYQSLAKCMTIRPRILYCNGILISNLHWVNVLPLHSWIIAKEEMIHNLQWNKNVVPYFMCWFIFVSGTAAGTRSTEGLWTLYLTLFLTGISQTPDNCSSIVRDELTLTNRKTDRQADGHLSLSLAPHPDSDMLHSRAKLRLGGGWGVYSTFIISVHKLQAGSQLGEVLG